MKNKLFNKILLGIALLLMTACKNPKIGIESFEIIDEKIDAEVYGAKVTGVFSFEGKMREMRMNVGLDESLTDAVEYVVDLDDHTFSAEIDNLNPNTTYYYNYGIDFGGKEDYLTEVNRFTTLQGPPLVKTVDTVAINAMSYQVKCEVISDGGADIIERGICWNTSGEPDLNDNKVKHDENTVGEYVCLMDSLQPNITYYVRAYATNNAGIGYGNTIPFTTSAPNKFTITVIYSPNEGHVEGGGDFAEGEFCELNAIANTHYVFKDWTENGVVVYDRTPYNFQVINNRTLVANFSPKKYPVSVIINPSNSGTVDGTGYYEFNQCCILTAHPNESYYFKNWTDLNGIVVSKDNPYQIDHVTDSIRLCANFTLAPTGSIDALFSVHLFKKVYFSQGNLQYQASPIGTWQFAEHQWDHIGLDNANISNDYNGWIDLFGWGTGEDPTNTGTTNDSTEWGENLITNGGNTPGLWRTLTQSEWDFVFNGRRASTINGVENTRYVKATVNRVQGIILFPDIYENSSGIDINPTTINTPEASFDNNIYSIKDWSMLEYEGCVFLPITGNRDITMIQNPNKGFYWSSTDCTSTGRNTAYGLHFDDSSIQTDSEDAWRIGESVRLVHDYQ